MSARGKEMIKFTPDMFHGLNHSLDEEFAANIANDKLDEWLKSAVKVYGRHKGDWLFSESLIGQDDTHTALLIDIKEIEKHKCEHEKIVIHVDGHITSGLVSSDFLTKWHCYHCGAKLKATWSEA